MRCRTLTLMLAMVGCIAVFTPPAVADYCNLLYWDHPCADDPEGTLTCEVTPADSEFCWCQGEWDENDHWLDDDCYPPPDSSHPTGWPSESGDIAYLIHSNTGYCDGGTKDGDPCSENDDCPSGTCDYYEMYLKVDLVTETISYLEVSVADTNATDEALDVQFNNIGACNGGMSHGNPCDVSGDCLRGTCVKSDKTLNVGELYLDADEGPLTIQVYDSVASVLLKTDTTD